LNCILKKFACCHQYFRRGSIPTGQKSDILLQGEIPIFISDEAKINFATSNEAKHTHQFSKWRQTDFEMPSFRHPKQEFIGNNNSCKGKLSNMMVYKNLTQHKHEPSVISLGSSFNWRHIRKQIFQEKMGLKLRVNWIHSPWIGVQIMNNMKKSSSQRPLISAMHKPNSNRKLDYNFQEQINWI
jgi:hypothetical protein